MMETYCVSELAQAASGYHKHHRHNRFVLGHLRERKNDIRKGEGEKERERESLPTRPLWNLCSCLQKSNNQDTQRLSVHSLLRKRADEVPFLPLLQTHEHLQAGRWHLGQLKRLDALRRTETLSEPIIYAPTNYKG
jgi:hypothetical protein